MLVLYLAEPEALGDRQKQKYPASPQVRYSEPAGYPAGSEYLTCGLAGYFCFCRSPNASGSARYNTSMTRKAAPYVSLKRFGLPDISMPAIRRYARQIAERFK